MKAAGLLPLLLMNVIPAAAFAGPADPWLTWIEHAETVLGKVNGYTVVFHKQERVHEILGPEETMRLKILKPFSVYCEWVNPKGRGGEAIYSPGWNKDRIRVHPGGIWGFFNFNIDPTGSYVKKNNRHPITDLGVDKLVAIIGSNVRRGLKEGEFSSVDHGRTTLFGKQALVLEGNLPTDPAKGYYCRRTIVYIDVESGIPLAIRNYDWSDQVVEAYGYENLRSDVLLTSADFDPKNPNYLF